MDGFANTEKVRQMNRDKDFYAWATTQAAALRARGTEEPLDWDGLAEEIDWLASHERHELEDRLTTIYEYLLRLSGRAHTGVIGSEEREWRTVILKNRDAICDILEDSPSLKEWLPSFAQKAYRYGRRYAGIWLSPPDEDWTARLPKESPWPLDRVLDPDFFSLSSD